MRFGSSEANGAGDKPGTVRRFKIERVHRTARHLRCRQIESVRLAFQAVITQEKWPSELKLFVSMMSAPASR